LIELVNFLESIHLLNEIFYRVNRLLKSFGRGLNPLTSEISAFLLNARQEFLDLLDVVIRSRSKHLFDDSGVNLEETDISLLRKVISEEDAVIAE
jgi:hypothetical protein